MLAFSGLPVFGWAKPVPVSLRGVREPAPREPPRLGGGAALEPAPRRRVRAAVFALGRPVAVEGEHALYPLSLIVGLSVLVNVSLAIFNLLPIPPLDGFGVVESLAAGLAHSRPSSGCAATGSSSSSSSCSPGSWASSCRPAREILVIGWLSRMIALRPPEEDRPLGPSPDGPRPPRQLLGRGQELGRPAGEVRRAATSSPTSTRSRRTTRTPPRSARRPSRP